MRHHLRLPRLGVLILFVALFTTDGFSQGSADLRGPVLGFLPDTRTASIRPILGIPGAAIVGVPIALDAPIRIAALSPVHDEALAVLDANPEVLSLLRFDAGTFERIDLPNVDAGVDVIAFSPSGSAAVVYDHETGLLQSLSLKPAAEVLFRLHISAIGGRLDAVAVSDSGKFAVLNFASGQGSETWVVNAHAERVLVPVPLSSAMAFAPASEEFFIVDAEVGQVSRVSQLGVMRSQGLLVLPMHTATDLLGITSIALSQDGLRIFGAAESGNALVLDVATGATLSLPCHCKASGVYPLKGRPVLRLSNPEDGPIAVLDARAQGAEVRVVLIPAEVTP